MLLNTHIFFCSLSFAQIARRGLMMINSIFLVTLVFFYSQWRKTSSDKMNCALNCPFLSDGYKRSTGQTAQVCESEAGGEESSCMCLTIAWVRQHNLATWAACSRGITTYSPCLSLPTLTSCAFAVAAAGYPLTA